MSYFLFCCDQNCDPKPHEEERVVSFSLQVIVHLDKSHAKNSSQEPEGRNHGGVLHAGFLS